MKAYKCRLMSMQYDDSGADTIDAKAVSNTTKVFMRCGGVNAMREIQQ